MIALKPLTNQVVVITGASSGIGLVTARQAAARGARVVVAARNEDALRQLVDELRAAGCEAAYVAADVGREEDVDEIARVAVETFGRIDTWVNNAGVSIFGGCMDVPVADMRRMYDTNFWGVVYGSRAAVRHFRARGGPGALINVGSIFGDRATPVQSTYASSKHALHGWTDALRMELEAAKEPVSVTLIHPGRIDTPYNEHARSYIAMQPTHQGMVYPPEAVADAILFAAAHPRRDLFVGSQAKLGALLGALAPRLTDRYMERHMFWSQQSKDRPSERPGDDALYEAGYGLHERGTTEGRVRPFGSVYVQAEKHPVLAALAVAGVGAAVAGLARAAGRPRRNGASRPSAGTAPYDGRTRAD